MHSRLDGRSEFEDPELLHSPHVLLHPLVALQLESRDAGLLRLVHQSRVVVSPLLSTVTDTLFFGSISGPPWRAFPPTAHVWYGCARNERCVRGLPPELSSSPSRDRLPRARLVCLGYERERARAPLSLWMD